MNKSERTITNAGNSSHGTDALRAPLPDPRRYALKYLWILVVLLPFASRADDFFEAALGAEPNQLRQSGLLVGQSALRMDSAIDQFKLVVHCEGWRWGNGPLLDAWRDLVNVKTYWPDDGFTVEPLGVHTFSGDEASFLSGLTTLGLWDNN